MNLKERAVATHRVVVTAERAEQDRIDRERREQFVKLLNDYLGEDLFFVPILEVDRSATIKSYVRNVIHGDVREYATHTYDVFTDGSVDIGVELSGPTRSIVGATPYVLLTDCPTPGCEGWIATRLPWFGGEDEDERFANLVQNLGPALAESEGKVCSDCEWKPCPTCGHRR